MSDWGDLCGEFIYSAIKGDFEKSYEALNKGASVDSANIVRNTGLMCAAHYGDLQFARVLLALGADIEKTDERRQTAISRAMAQEHKEIASLLQEVQADESKRPTPEEVGFDMEKRNAALAELGIKAPLKPSKAPKSAASSPSGESQIVEK